MTIEIKIIFQNKDVVVLDKPAGVLTTPSRAGADDQRSVLGVELQKTIGHQIFPVHRLDFEVSGLVMFALNAQAHKMTNRWFERRCVHKHYEALSLSQQNFSHIPANLPIARTSFHAKLGQSYEWKCQLLRGKRRAYEHAKGDLSLTKVSLVDEVSHRKVKEQILWRWRLEPITGRSHQLRYEMSRHGYAIVGDGLYGSNQKWETDQIALRAVEIDFSEISDSDRLGLPAHLKTEGL